jgi:hypothetical protein
MLTHLFVAQNSATSGLVELMALLPPTTLFFINTWTWGYEDILKAIFAAFNSKVVLPIRHPPMSDFALDSRRPVQILHLHTHF